MRPGRSAFGRSLWSQPLFASCRRRPRTRAAARRSGVGAQRRPSGRGAGSPWVQWSGPSTASRRRSKHRTSPGGPVADLLLPSSLVAGSGGAEPDVRELVILDTSALVSDPEASFAFPEAETVIPLTV